MGSCLKTTAMATETSLVEMNSVVKRETNTRERTDSAMESRKVPGAAWGDSTCRDFAFTDGTGEAGGEPRPP